MIGVMRSRHAILAITLAVLGLAQAVVPTPPARADALIRHVHIIDVTGGPTLRDQRIGIAGDRIVSIGPDDGTPIEAAAVIDGGGAFVIPGLWEMHAHLLEYPGLPVEAVADATFPLYLANGVVGVRDMGTHDYATLKHLRDAVQAGRMVGPHLVITGRPLDGAPPTDALKQPVATAAEARQAVRDLKASGADFVKVYERLSKAAYLAVADESRVQNLPFAGHVPLAVTPREATLAGQRSIEHMGQGRLREACYGYLPEGASPPPDADPAETATLLRALNDALAGRSTEGVWAPDTRAWVRSSPGRATLDKLQRDLGQVSTLVVLRRRTGAAETDLAVLAKQARGERTYRFLDDVARGIEWLPDEPDVELPGHVQALAESLRTAGTWLTPTLTPLRAIAHRSELMARPDPRLAYVTAEVRNELDPAADPRYKMWTALEWTFVKRVYEQDAHLAAVLRHQGVHVLTGTDGITDYALPGFGVHDELALLVAAGFSPLEALQAATIEPAAFLNRTREAGTVTVGKLADLVLLDADPLADIHNATLLRAVIRNGRYFERAELDLMLQRVRELVGAKR